MLRLQIGFPAGRYFAASSDDPRQPEWPPHPSRVYSALVAAAYGGGRTPSEAERRLLQVLEAAGAPALSCPPAHVEAAPDNYVPVNDEKSRLSPAKSPGVLLPNRQVRQFPVAFMLGEPEIQLTWPVDLPEQDVQVLDALAARVTHVGTSHSFATARFLEGAETWTATLVPRDDGDQYLRVPLAGRLDELDRLASQGSGTLRRPTPRHEVLVPYGLADAPRTSVIASPYDWVTLRVHEASWGADTAHTFARAVRRAVLSILGNDAPAVVHGHDEGILHVGWLPLADVGHPYATGRLRGLSVAIPLNAPAQDRALLLAGLARLETVQLPDGQVARLTASVDGPETIATLRESTWRRPSTHWSTVTPVLLDRPPKRWDLRLYAAAVADSLRLAGMPEPSQITVLDSSDFEGGPSAREIPTTVPRVHARVVFSEPVQGPVIAGRWRNFGIGLFRPTPMELRA